MNSHRNQQFLIVGTGFLVQAVYVGLLFMFGILFLEFEETFGWSRALISGAFSVFLLGTGFIGIAMGKLNDLFGPRRIMIAGALIHGAGYALMSLIQAPWQLYFFYGVLVAVGFSTHDILTLSTIARWFTAKRSLMSGIVKAGAGAGTFVVPILVTTLLSVWNWRIACLVVGAASTLILIFLAQFLTRNPPSTPAPSRGDSTPAPQTEFGLTLKLATKTRNFWILCFGQFLIFSCLMVVMIHVAPHARDLGFGTTQAAKVLSTIGAASILGRIILGGAADRLGGKRTLIIAYSLLSASLIWLIFIREPWILFLFAPVYGFTHGAFFTLISPTIAEFFGTRSHGVIFAIVLFPGTIGGALSPLIAGHVFDTLGSYQPVFICLAGLAVAGLVLVYFLHSDSLAEIEVT
ncbi:MAG: MFS transporter [Pseudomonadota bacterium]|nr:MFS transporter [Arenicellales bacterium]MEE3282735.1 MFS transporter [Pseudomonadota bacterium]